MSNVKHLLSVSALHNCKSFNFHRWFPLPSTCCYKCNSSVNHAFIAGVVCISVLAKHVVAKTNTAQVEEVWQLKGKPIFCVANICNARVMDRSTLKPTIWFRLQSYM